MNAMISFPDYMERRIRRPAPSHSFVIPGSTPVVAFGNSRTAVVATLGINPSRLEFLDKSGEELVGPDRRLATHSSLGTSELTESPLDVVSQVVLDRNPYSRWFDPMEQILQHCSASYYDNSACHLDLVHWATNPTWSSLNAPTRDRLIEADIEFLKEQLTKENISLLLVNGKSVIGQLRRQFGASLMEVGGIRDYNTRFYEGIIFDDVYVIGWSTNLQSSFGVSNERRTEIAKRVASINRSPSDCV